MHGRGCVEVVRNHFNKDFRKSVKVQNRLLLSHQPQFYINSILSLLFSITTTYISAHSQDVGIECDTLLPYLAETFYWKGIYFEPTNSSEKKGSSSLEHVDIENALEGVNAVKNAPDLLHITINDSASGLNIKELAKPLAVFDSSILGPVLVGVNIESSCGNVVIENVTVQNARFGGGLIYKHLAVNFCSVIPEEASFPLLLDAAGNHHPVNCRKVGTIVLVKMSERFG